MASPVSSAAIGLALVGVALALAGRRWWRRRRDRESLLCLVTGLHLVLLGLLVVLAVLALDDLDLHPLALLAAAGWLALLTGGGTFLTLPQDAPLVRAPARLVLRATGLGAASGWAFLLGVGAVLAVDEGIAVLVILALYGTLPALVLGALVGLAMGLVDLALLARLRRGAR